MTGNPAPPGDAVVARRLIRAAGTAALGTTRPDGGPAGGSSHVSLVVPGCAPDLAPLLLLSDLAEHTRHIAAEPRVSLLYAAAGDGNPLEQPRVTVLGSVARTTDPGDRARYLARHPGAELFAGFDDFNFYRVTMDRAHLVAGFGQIAWIEAADLAPPPAPDLMAAAGDVVAHMNEDHGDALDLYAEGLLGLAGEGWRMTGIDVDGADLRLGETAARLDFPAPVTTPGAARTMLVNLVADARRRVSEARQIG